MEGKGLSNPILAIDEEPKDAKQAKYHENHGDEKACVVLDLGDAVRGVIGGRGCGHGAGHGGDVLGGASSYASSNSPLADGNGILHDTLAEGTVGG